MNTIAEMFPVPAEIKRLGVLLGDWNVEGELHTGGRSMRIQGTWLFETAAGGWAIKSSNKLAVEGLGDYYLDNLFGFDRETGTLHVYSITNMAETHDHTAAWHGSSEIRGSYAGLKAGKNFREDFTVRITDADSLTIDYVEKAGGELDSTMEVRLRRK